MSLISESSGGVPASLPISIADPGDYLALLKPRVMSLVVFTALAGILIAPPHVHPVIGFASLLAIAVGAGASGALNMWYEADIDALMKRTRKRPIPSGKLSGDDAFAFGAILAVISVLTLGLVANWFAAALLAFTIFFYVVVYTVWLKRSTPQNIVIGGAAGALPPVVGYAAVSGDVSLASCALFLIIFFWTPPHFWSLALLRAGDYEKAGVPMMPNVKGADRTRLEILLYTIVLTPFGLAPWLLGFASPAYGVLAVLLGALMLACAAGVYAHRTGERAEKSARRLFGFSILYLFLLFAELVVEHSFGVIHQMAGGPLFRMFTAPL